MGDLAESASSSNGPKAQQGAELLFTHFSEFGGPNMDIFGGKSEDFGSPLHQIYSLFGGNSEDFGCPVDRHGT